MSLTPHPGFYGWRLLLALWVISTAVTGFTFYGTPVLFPYMVEELGWSRTQISSGMMTALLMMGVSTPLCSWCINRFGSRVTIVIGGLVGSIGMFFMQFADSVYAYLLLFGVIAGSGISFSANISIQTVITHWFKRRRGLAFGLVLAGGATGGFISPIVITEVIAWSGGNWRTGWFVMTVMFWIAVIACLLFVRNKPADVGQYPDGIDPNEQKADSPDQTAQKIHRATVEWRLADAVRTRQLWLLIIAIIGGQFIWQVLLSQAPLHLADRGFSSEQYSLIYGATIGISVIGRLGAGILVDFIDPKKVFLVALGMASLGSVLFWYVRPESLLSLAYPVFSGIALGAITIAIPNLVANYWGEAAFASVNGVIFPIMIAFNSSAPLLAGFLYDKLGSYLPILALSWVLLLTAFVAMSLMTPPTKPTGPE
jgi:MFS family permease